MQGEIVMKVSIRVTGMALTCLALLSSTLTSAPEAKPAVFAGLARTEITPPIGGKMWGYEGRGVSTGIHDPLFATVLVLSSAETKVAIVSWDVCEFQSPWLQKQVADLGIPHLLLCSTHTHAGPDLHQTDFPSSEKPCLRTAEERILTAIRQAQSNLFPAFISAGEGQIQLGYNRIQRGPDGLGITWFENPERIPFGPVDPTVGVIRISGEDGKLRAVLAHYACHAVVLGPANRLISADYPGAMVKMVEQRLGPNAYCIFLQGAAGDINPLFLARGPDTNQNFAVVDTMGKYLAEEVLKTLDGMDRSPGKSEKLQVATGSIAVPNRWEPEKKPRFGVASLLINGEIGMVSIPGEPFNEFQRSLRARAELSHVFLLSYTDNSVQDWPNYYLPDIRSAAHAGYGASDSTIAGLGTGEQLVDLGLIQLFTMRGMFREKPWRPPAKRFN
jgi:hypothetical protein